MAKTAIFPAPSALGTSIYTHLFKLLDAESLLLISRHPENTPPHLLEASVTTQRADYSATESFHDPFDDVSILVLISYPSIEIEHRFAAHKAAIDTARRSGVSYISYTSLAFGGDCSSSSAAHVMQAHLLTEKYLLEQSKLAGTQPFSFTVIREDIYSESLPMYTGFPSLHSLALSEDVVIEVQIPHGGSGPGMASHGSR